MPEPFELEQLLWDLRHDPRVVARVQADPVGTMREYGLSQFEIDALSTRDFSRLLALGAAPMLLYFGALELGVSREDYYAALAGGDGRLGGGDRRAAVRT